MVEKDYYIILSEGELGC
ncbi:Protein of unknown function [Bacillus cereus]|nr:Protein of unknown function [Bacillus cereus]